MIILMEEEEEKEKMDGDMYEEEKEQGGEGWGRRMDNMKEGTKGGMTKKVRNNGEGRTGRNGSKGWEVQRCQGNSRR